jgi:Protein of unknown function (DUF3096)
MMFSLAMDRTGYPARNPTQFMRRRIVPDEFAMQRCNYRQFRTARWNPLKPQASAIVEPRQRIKSASIRQPPHRDSGEISMVITAAHIQPIVALLAGILILIMPRFLNLVVAIYLICVGLIGLGVLKWLHM